MSAKMKILTILATLVITSSQVVALNNAKDLFLFLDQDNSKSLTVQEFNEPTRAIWNEINPANHDLSFNELNGLLEKIESNISFEQFKNYDYNKDNVISEDEMEDLSYRISSNNRYGSSDLYWYRILYVNVALFAQFNGAQALFIAHDHNGDGAIDFAESFNDDLTEQRLVFLSLDADESASISLEELFSQRNKAFENLDADDDELLSFREFNRLKQNKPSRKKSRASQSGRKKRR